MRKFFFPLIFLKTRPEISATHRENFQLVAGKNKHHVWQSIVYPIGSIRSNRYGEEHEQAHCLSKHDDIFFTFVFRWGFFPLFIFVMISSFSFRCKKSFRSAPKSSFSFFSSIRPFFLFNYHPRYVTWSTSTNSSQSARRLMQVIRVLPRRGPSWAMAFLH